MQSRTLTEEEIVTYRESGFIKAGGIVSSDELDRFAGAVDNEIEKGRVRDVSGPKEGQSATFFGARGRLHPGAGDKLHGRSSRHRGCC